MNWSDSTLSYFQGFAAVTAESGDGKNINRRRNAAAAAAGDNKKRVLNLVRGFINWLAGPSLHPKCKGGIQIL